MKIHSRYLLVHFCTGMDEAQNLGQLIVCLLKSTFLRQVGMLKNSPCVHSTCRIWLEMGGSLARHHFVCFLFQVRDGSSSSSPLLGKFCGTNIPARLQSTQRSMYIQFRTDASVSNHGFEAVYDSAIEGKQIHWIHPIQCSLTRLQFNFRHLTVSQTFSAQFCMLFFYTVHRVLCPDWLLVLLISLLHAVSPAQNELYQRYIIFSRSLFSLYNTGLFFTKGLNFRIL